VPFSFHQEVAKLAKTDPDKADQLLDRVEAEKWGDKYEAVIEATGLSYQGVADTKYVSAAFPDFSRRREKLSFKHHREVAALSPERADELLSLAETNHWSTRRLREEAGAPATAPKNGSGGGSDHNHRAQGTGENEWYTPAQYLEAARELLGGFDLDPATSESAQARVRRSSAGSSIFVDVDKI
jgi:hypothetical protein